MTKRKPRNRENRTLTQANSRAGLIYGRHAVRAALKNQARSVHHLYLNRTVAAEFAPLARARALPTEIIDSEKLRELVPQQAVHQGVVLHTEPPPAPSLAQICANHQLILLADQITDPHNIGAILRSAAAFGAGALVQTRHHAPPLDGALTKAASGAVDKVPLIEIGNLVRGLDTIKKAGYFVIGLDESATSDVSEVPDTMPYALVLGGEENGMRRLTRENCNICVRISMPEPETTPDRFTTLNVSNAAAIALYVLTRKMCSPVKCAHP